MFSLSSPNYTKTYYNPTRSYMQYVQSANIIGLPIFWRLNNRLSLISPVLEFGIEPFLVQENFKIQGQPTIRTKLTVGLGAKCGLGVGLNYQRFRLRYLYYVDELPGSSLTLQYQLY